MKSLLDMPMCNLFENMPRGYAVCKAVLNNGILIDFIHLEVNKNFEYLTSLQHVANKKLSELSSCEVFGNSGYVKLLSKVVLSRKPEKLELYVTSLDLWLDILFYCPAKNHVVCLLDNITERKMKEENLREQLDEVIDYKYALEKSSILSVTDRNGIINYANENFCQISQYTKGELVGQDHRITCSEYHSNKFFALLWETVNGPHASSKN